MRVCVRLLSGLYLLKYQGNRKLLINIVYLFICGVSQESKQ